ncbi:MAG TPA: chemotaxis response regulator protein-glutamate methylesterase [Candidatus Paceibacterota bacterium]|nr:chemotaxis response regulator protein-glutamate methylesterase [Verrucomicrobiota bacterium]HRY51105.1 chemotaxis response regulator protein-glutamate methylesterase [Candidatus Paceibacterota bacterium]HRZ99720.1 chemotaxis response regulator protein-glutamate methylesterase [Candidatus Paceibacterota bacterium]
MRIAIVNDLPLAVLSIQRALARTPEHEVIWVASDGAQAVEHSARNRPDLILMDLVMPVMNGVEATRQIMTRCPCAILIVTVSVEEHLALVFEAMGAGALDAVNTPGGGTEGGEEAAPLLAKIRTLARLIEPVESCPDHAYPEDLQATRRQPRVTLIALGASAGGPGALAQIVRDLPENLPAGLVIVQHVDPQFAPGLATWLQDQCRWKVRLAEEGDQVQPGIVLLAGQDRHLVLTPGQRLTFNLEPLQCPYRPCIDVFFESVTRHWKGKAIGILLTGMGRDGARGLKMLRDAGHRTLVQNRETSAVFGMPKAAIEIDAADEVLPLGEIAMRIRYLLSGKNFPQR